MAKGLKIPKIVIDKAKAHLVLYKLKVWLNESLDSEIRSEDLEEHKIRIKKLEYFIQLAEKHNEEINE